MKILHIWNTAGVGSTIAKFMDKYYHTDSFVINRKVLDPFHWNLYGETLDCGATMFMFYAIVRSYKHDIVHIHGLDKIIPFILRKPIVLHYHGSEIKHKWKEHKKHWRKADVILYSTPDLLQEDTPKNAILLPTIVDTDLFVPQKSFIPNTAITVDKNLNKQKAMKYAEKHNIKLFIQSRTVSYCNMPQVFESNEFYFDMKTTGDPLSKTGLEALACGLKVINNKEEIIVGLPKQHRPENVCKTLVRIYAEIT